LTHIISRLERNVKFTIGLWAPHLYSQSAETSVFNNNLGSNSIQFIIQTNPLITMNTNLILVKKTLSVD